MPLENSKIIVAGGSAGIGLETVQVLSNKGATVIALGRNEERLKRVKSLCPTAHTAQVDASDRASLDYFFQKEGKLDHLIISLTGGKGNGMFKELNLEDLLDGFKAKVIAHLNTVQAALPYMHSEGSITLVTSISSKSGAIGTSGLAAINGSLDAMIPALAKEIKPIRINAIAPGVIDTEYWNFMNPTDKEKAFENYASKIPLQRIGRPSEVANAILFVIENKYVTGTVIPIDGGLSL